MLFMLVCRPLKPIAICCGVWEANSPTRLTSGRREVNCFFKLARALRAEAGVLGSVGVADRPGAGVGGCADALQVGILPGRRNRDDGPAPRAARGTCAKD